MHWTCRSLPQRSLQLSSKHNKDLHCVISGGLESPNILQTRSTKYFILFKRGEHIHTKYFCHRNWVRILVCWNVLFSRAKKPGPHMSASGGGLWVKFAFIPGFILSLRSLNSNSMRNKPARRIRVQYHLCSFQCSAKIKKR